MLSYKHIYGVTELTAYLKELLEGDTRLANIWVRGEISNLRCSASGHLYLTLKDGQSRLPCIMFYSQSKLLKFQPRDGMIVLARGYISLYSPHGAYQLYILELQPAGTGELYLAFERLKEKLQREGFFDPASKKRIPFLPNKIGIVTSPTGAAFQDIISVIRRKFSEIELVLNPVRVQGEGAAKEIAEAIEQLNRYGKVDVIIIARGGGSLEEIWPFNTEIVARSIYASVIPVISGVGHDTDVTIADFVSDCRAPTPSAAAELAVPLKEDLVSYVQDLSLRLTTSLSYLIRSGRERVSFLAESRVLAISEKMFDEERQNVDNLYEELHKSTGAYFQNKRYTLGALAVKLEALSPLAVLNRGFSVCRNLEDKRIITDFQKVFPGTTIEVLLKKGILMCRVEHARRSVFDRRKKASQEDEI